MPALRERAGTADEHGLLEASVTISRPSSSTWLDTANLAHGVSVALLDQHELLVEHHGIPCGQAGGG